MPTLASTEDQMMARMPEPVHSSGRVSASFPHQKKKKVGHRGPGAGWTRCTAVLQMEIRQDLRREGGLTGPLLAFGGDVHEDQTNGADGANAAVDRG